MPQWVPAVVVRWDVRWPNSRRSAADLDIVHVYRVRASANGEEYSWDTPGPDNRAERLPRCLGPILARSGGCHAGTERLHEN